MLSRLLYYCLLLPLSWLPLNFLYVIARLVYSIVYKIIGYRRKVVAKNIARSFPNLSRPERLKIEKDFYSHLANLLAESIKNLSISKKALSERLVVENPDLFDKLYDQKKSVILLGSHICNWEFFITSQNFLFKHQAIGIGTPLSNAFLNKKINALRARFGMTIVSNENYKTALKLHSDKPTATLILGDQSPSKAENAYWTHFLNQTTAFFFGAEIMANQYNCAVVYCQMTLAKKGHYRLTLKEITADPSSLAYGSISQAYINLLEADIKANPAFWLWSHKRWKMTVPKNLDILKKEHETRFKAKFRE